MNSEDLITVKSSMWMFLVSALLIVINEPAEAVMFSSQCIENVPWKSRAGAKVIIAQDKIWMHGGVWDYYVLDSWMSPDGKSWTKVSVSSQQHLPVDSVLFYNAKSFWLAGGHDGLFTFRSDLWKSSDFANWELYPTDMPQEPRSFSDAVLGNQQVILLGGTRFTRDGSKGGMELLHDVWSSKDAINWQLVSNSVPWGLGTYTDFRACYYRDKFWAFGYTQENELNLWSSESGRSWESSSANLPTACGALAELLVWRDQLLLVTHGEMNSGMQIWIRADGSHFEKVELEQTLPSINGPSIVELHDQIFIIGGSFESNKTSHKVTILTPKSGE